MKFSTAIVATALLVSTAFAVPTAEPELKTRGLVRAGKFGYCIAPGQMCYKSKRDIDEAIDNVITGYEAPLPEELEKRDASPEPRKKALLRAQRFGYCIAPGQMCYKSKRDLDEARSFLAQGSFAPLPHEFE